MITLGHEPIPNPGHTLQVGPSITSATPCSWAHTQLAIYYGQLSALVVHTVPYNSATLCVLAGDTAPSGSQNVIVDEHMADVNNDEGGGDEDELACYLLLALVSY